MKNDIVAVILAAGKSTRMNSSFSKVLHKIYGKSMLEYVLDDMRAIGITEGVIVINHQNRIDQKIEVPQGYTFAFQKKLLGTGNAVRQAQKELKDFRGDVLVLYGDTPLLTQETLTRLLQKHRSSNASCTLLTTSMKNPFGYGRIVRNEKRDITRIAEEATASLY